MKRTPLPPGTKVYELNICQAIRDHAKCPGFTTPRRQIQAWSGRLQVRLPQGAVT
jgi:hypothetical protein